MSSPMIEWKPLWNHLYKILATNTETTESIDLPSVQIHQIETAPERRSRTLKHLLRANHINYSILYNNLRFHNHLPHILGSAYILGADAQHLQRLHDEESKNLEAWQDSPAEITNKDWREFLGDKRYSRAFIDFFEDENALKFDYDWKSMVEEYLFSGEEPLIHGIIAGLGHPLIHLGYAYELSCKEVAIEALALTSVSYDYLHKYIECRSYTKSPDVSFSPLEILDKIHEDSRFDNLVSVPGPANIDSLFDLNEDLVLEYWNLWSVDDSLKQFETSQRAAVALLTQTVQSGCKNYDFFLVHLLTTSHAIRILLPLIPKKFHLSLIKQWWLFTICVYISQLRPKINHEIEVAPSGTRWNYVEEKALRGRWATDPHYVKAIRAIKEVSQTWGDDNGHYLSAAVKFADGFDGWTGFPPSGQENN